MLGQNHSRRRASSAAIAKPVMSILSLLLSRRLPYRYVPLERNQIRLLKLWPGERTTQIHCSLHTVDLLSYDDQTAESPVEDFEFYDAVSYVWGKGPKTVEIICDDRSLWITASLANALHRFRSLRHPSILWADALCINQKDINERAEQVQLMGLIYFKARQVRIWLGIDHEPVYHASHAATLIHKFADPFQNTPGITARRVSEEIFRQRTKSDDVHWEAVRRLLEREWFKRVWVVQELGLSRNATFYCGETEFTRQDLYDFVYILEHSKSGLLVSYDINVRMLRLGERYNDATWGKARIKLASSPEGAETFLDLLSKTRGLKCADKRDSIYAFLGHPSAFKQHRLDDEPYRSYPQNYYNCKPPIVRPKYDDSVTFLRACTDLAINAVKDRGLGLHVLAHITHDEDTVSLEVPSWVPQWNVLTQTSHFHMYDRFYQASGSLETTSMKVFTPAGNPCGSRLCLRALKLAQLRFATIEPATLSVQTLIETLFPERVTETSYNKLHALDWPAARSRIRTSVNEWSALAITLTAGLITTDTYLTPVPVKYHLDRQVNAMESFVRRYERGPPRIQCSQEDDIAEYFQMDLDRAGHSRIFYVTSEGQFGLAPMVTREGDQVWLPLGATMPFILRPLSEGVFKILGQTYLHGAMNGEAVEDKTEDAFRTVLLC